MKNKEKEFEKILRQVEDVLIVKGYNEALRYFKEIKPNEPDGWYRDILNTIEKQ